MTCDACKSGHVLFEDEYILCPAISSTCRYTEWNRENSLKNIGLERHYHSADMAEMSLMIRSEVEDYCQNIEQNVKDGQGIAILGPKGTGKSMALALIAKATEVIGFNCTYIRMPELFTLAFDDDGRETLEQLSYRKLLLIDDIGTGYVHELPTAAFDTLVEKRWSRNLATCWTSNLTETRLRASDMGLFERAIDRLLDVKRAKILVVTGKSERTK